MSKWIDISDILRIEAKPHIKTGSLLGFMRDGEVHHYQVKRKSKGKIWVAPMKRLYDREELDGMSAEEFKKKARYGK